MFRLIRLPFLLAIAFVVGVFYERNHSQELCAAANGKWVRGICVGAEM